MKTRFSLCKLFMSGTRLTILALAAFLPSAYAVTLSLSSASPIPGPYDIYNFSGADMDMNNVFLSGSAPATNGSANDGYTYVAHDRLGQGQTFTTGSSSGGYLLTDLWAKHAGYTANTGNGNGNGNGTWWGMAGDGGLTVRITNPSQAGNSGFVLSSETYATTGGEGWPTSATSSLNGDGMWLHFTLATPVLLATSTTYGFDLTSVINNNTFFEWLGNATNVFNGGAAYRGGTAGTPDNTLTALVGNRVFLVQLSPQAHPQITGQLVASNQVQISWPAVNASYLLQTTSNLTWPWNYSGLPVSTVNGTNFCTDPATSNAAFYRLLYANGALPIPVAAWQTNADGLTFQMYPGTLRLQVFSPRVVRVAYSATNSIPTNSLAVTAAATNSGWSTYATADDVWLTTAQLQVRVSRATGAVGFYDTNGAVILSEPTAGGKTLSPATVGGISTLQSRQQFVISSNEAVYGLGQHAAGLMNYRGASVHLQQKNPTESAIPVLVSSRGYGLLWDNPAVCDVSVAQSSPTNLTWTSEASDSVDYYFMYGPELDDVVAGYRNLTGTPPLFGKWAWELWQCKNAYSSQAELTNVVNTYRADNIPLDCIIQDWQWWWNSANTSQGNAWGSHIFYAPNYPDPTNLMTTLHAANAHAIISVWPRFDVGIQHAIELAAVNGLYTNVLNNVYPPGQGQWYDPFNPAARQVYWGQMSGHIFSTGFDGWWFDASECELSGNWGEFRNFTTAAGPGARVFNAYPLMHTTTAYQGQRAQTSSKRVFILTRSAYAGQQRNAAVTWSGDIGSSFAVLANQIPAGLNFSISGVPYWNTDTGGFNDGSPTDTAYAEVFTRWFQFSTFCPMLRIHGNNAKEIWRFPAATQTILINYDKLRYHLLPYNYSVSWQVTSAGYTMMRPLVMDFRQDTNVFGIKDQFMFGPALMACPVTTAGATNRSVYLPAGATWYDFWTGQTNAGGQTVSAAAAIDTMPIFVRAGSILPYGPDIQYAMQTNDPVELRVYRGANSSFTLYEDEGDNYNYESGSYATIPITWNESTQTLTIGARQGSFPGMLTNRTFRIVCVGTGLGTGVASTPSVNSVVGYNGNAISVSPTTPPPLIPTGLNANVVSSSQINLTWNAVTNASSYNVKRSLTNGGSYTTIASVVTTTNYQDTGLAGGTVYYYVVSAVNSGGESTNSAQAAATTLSPTVGSLAHRYSFSETNGTTVADSVGGPVWNGTLPSGGTFSGGQLVLSSNQQQYVNLPAGIVSNLTAVTIETWVTIPNQLPTHCFLFGFGNISGSSGNSYIFCQPKDRRIAITASDWSGEQNTSPNPSGNWMRLTNLHVTAVFNPPAGYLALYTNGVQAAYAGSITNLMSVVNDLYSFIGRSLYSGDSYFNFNLDEFRIYNGALDTNQIAATQALGPDQLLSTNSP